MNPVDAINERNRVHGTPDICFSCKRAYRDIEEGWNCRKYDAVITLSNGRKMRWSGQACDRAYENDCKGDGFERAFLPSVVRRNLLLFIIPFSVVVGVFFLFVTDLFKNA